MRYKPAATNFTGAQTKMPAGKGGLEGQCGGYFPRPGFFMIRSEPDRMILLNVAA
jgi:hypothetical protein